MLAIKNPTTTAAWKALQLHFERVKNVTLQELFKEHPTRAKDYSLFWWIIPRTIGTNLHVICSYNWRKSVT